MNSPEPLVNFQRDFGLAYQIERELPRGGMSRVFVATESALGRQVVVKVLSRELGEAVSAERFEREIAIAARLQHPYIVPLLSAGQAGERVYYTMPFVDGESLRERIDVERPMNLEHVTRIVEDIASALAYAHAQGVVHRDIKPDNVMSYRDHAVVLDFGIGKAVSDALRRDESFPRFESSARHALGSPLYMAPEQCVGDPRLDHRADLYALGVVAYEMITGHPPFHGPDAGAIFIAHSKQRPEPVAEQRADVPAALAAIVMRCLEKNPARRPQSGEEIVHSLRARGSAPTPRAGSAALIARAPAWLPWAIAALATIVAIAAMAALLLRR